MRQASLFLSTIVLMSGCAFTEVRIPLPTAPSEAPASGGNNRQVVLSIPFKDERAISHRCGMQKNGYNMDTANAVCVTDPNAWIAERVAHGLRTAGFSVLEPGADHRPGALKVDGSLIKIFVEPIIGAWSGSMEADLSIRLKATTETGLIAERTFFVKGWKGGLMISTTQPYVTSLHRASGALVEETVRAIIELMDQYPQLGQRQAPTLRVAYLASEVHG